MRSLLWSGGGVVSFLWTLSLGWWTGRCGHFQNWVCLNSLLGRVSSNFPPWVWKFIKLKSFSWLATIISVNSRYTSSFWYLSHVWIGRPRGFSGALEPMCLSLLLFVVQTFIVVATCVLASGFTSSSSIILEWCWACRCRVKHSQQNLCPCDNYTSIPWPLESPELITSFLVQCPSGAGQTSELCLPVLQWFAIGYVESSPITSPGNCDWGWTHGHPKGKVLALYSHATGMVTT